MEARHHQQRPSSEEPNDIARAWHTPLPTRILTVVAAMYLGSIWLDAVGSNLHTRLLPNTLTYFTQVAGLFTTAALATIEYRVEGWDCAGNRWREIDPRPDFPMDADSKENRFYRALHFFRQRRPVMHALDEFLVGRHNARAREGRETIGLVGGIRTQSIRVPFPKPGQKVEPYVRLPADSYPEEERRYWYWTQKSRREERCGGPVSPSGE
ncbi:MAG TPA: hypothetical protein VF395_04220 [Polyangiaceae bacterium]